MTRAGDADLIQAVLAGEQEAFASLVARYQEPLFRRALVLLGDPDLTADMVQETFVRAYMSLARADPDRFAAWIHRILRNLCLDELRSPRGRCVTLPGNVRTLGGPEQDLARRELRDAVATAVSGLGPTVREAFVLKHVEGLSYEEMTALTGVAVGALKMRVKRAREALQRQLQPHSTDAM